ncbi:Zinc finger and SCAN domain-containing protein [Schistosoma japonicum]|uniref:Zinc finger and SCAN domain-containing protein n=1 Tax=Schistosoma japonicum TaxID=6182 RepID=A0A4Z2DWU7_SCHJA|nr:Zinc finger and SCAN domain-containing protein [Schistosoma japonicum]TNN21032.1 Zinc finger and SCAN domain-containing protein [Schistosoma japonicum]
MILLQMSSQTRLATNHGSLKLRPFIVNETINLTQDCGLIKRGDESDFYLSPLPTPLADEIPINNNTIPGMQEVFDKLASRPHPSPILAATLTKFGGHVDVCQESVTNKFMLNSSRLSNYTGSDFSKKSQAYFKTQSENSASFVDLNDFPSSPISGAFADFQSLRYVSLSLDCSSSASISLSTANSVLDQCVDESDCLPVFSNCPPNLEEEETDLVPSELVQFVSESTRQIPSDLVDVVSAGDSDIEDIDHEARLASLCIPILRSPSLGHSHLLDNAQPPTLSPESSGCPHSPFDHIDISSDPSYEKSYFSQTPDRLTDSVNKQHILSPELLSLPHDTSSDELVSRNDADPPNNIDTFISAPLVDTSNFISNNNSYTCNSGHQDLIMNCSSSVMDYSTSELSEHEMLPTNVCNEYKVSSSSSSAETSLPPNNICVSQVGSFTQQPLQNHFIVKDVLNNSDTGINNLSHFQCIIANNRSVSSMRADDRYTSTIKVPSVVNVICTPNDGKNQPVFSSTSDMSECVDSTILGSYHQDKSRSSEQILNGDPQSTICESSFIPNLRFSTLIGSQNTSQLTVSQSTSSFNQVLLSNGIRESICEPSKCAKQLIVSSQVRNLITAPNDHAFTSNSFTTSCFAENTYVDSFTPLSSKEEVSVTHTPLILSTPSFQIAPHPSSTQCTFVVSQPVTPGVISSTELHSSTPVVLSLKGRTCVEASQPQVTNLSTSSGCVLLPLQILNSLPTINPGMSILLNVKNGNVMRQNSSPCLPNFTSVNSLSDKSCTIASENNGSVFLLPTTGIVTNLNGNVSNIPIVQLPTQQPVNFIPPTLSTSLLSNSNVPTFRSSSTLPTSFNTIPVDIKHSTPAQLPLGTQLFILRSASKANVINPTYFNTSLSASTVSGAFTTPLPASSTGLTVVLANPNHKNFSDSGNLVFLPTVSSRSSIFPLCTTNPLASIFSTASSTLVTTTSTSSWPHISNVISHDINTLVSNSTTLNSSSVTTANSSNVNFRSSLDTLSDTSLSFPLTLLPNTAHQTVILSSPSWTSLSSNSNYVFTSSPSFNTHSFLSPVTTLSTSSSMSSSSYMSFDNNSLPSPSISCSSANMDISKSNQSVTSSPIIGGCLLPTVSSLSSITLNCSNKDGTNNKACTPTSSHSHQSDVKTSVIVLPSADKLLSSRNFSQLSSLSTQHTSKFQDVKCRRLSYSCPNTPSIPSTTVTVSTTTSASLQTVVTSSTTMVTCCSRRRHQCPYCPKSCERKDNLQAHIRTHTGERPYPCRYCPKAFPQKDHLRAHIRTHTGEKPYRCPQCLKAFAQLGNLHRHVKTHRR